MITEPTLRERLRTARQFVEEGKLLHAAQLYQSLTRVTPDLDEAWIELAAIYRRQGHVRSAVRTLERAVECSSNQAEFQWRLGDYLLEAGDVVKARRILERLAQGGSALRPWLRCRVYQTLGRLHLARESYVAAQRWFERAASTDRNFPGIDEMLGELLLLRDRPAEALPALRRAIDQNPDGWFAYDRLGRALALTGKTAQAVEAFNAALDRHPTDPDLWRRCGEQLLKKGDRTSAERYLRKALRLDPANAEALTSFGWLLIDRGEAKSALPVFEEALRCRPGSKDAREGIQTALTAAGVTGTKRP